MEKTMQQPLHEYYVSQMLCEKINVSWAWVIDDESVVIEDPFRLCPFY